MNVKKKLGLAIIAALTICLTACGSSFPELTDEEYAQTVEFAVGLLMKYSNNDQAKLTYVDAKELKKQREKEERKAAREAALEESKNTQASETKTETTPPPAPQENNDTFKDVDEKDKTEEPVEAASKEETVAVEPKDDTRKEDEASAEETKEVEESTKEASEEASEAKSEESGKEEKSSSGDDSIVVSADESQEIEKDIFLTYEGYSVSRSYPESSKSYVINADKGKRLLVLRFDLYNGSNSSKNINLLKKNITFQVLLNDRNVGYSAVTVLPNDLASYVGTIDSRAHESLVVLTEISQEESTEIKTLGLIATISGKKQTINLK